MRIEPVFLFDLDGTLVDSVYQHVLAWKQALDSEGIELSVWRIHRKIGMSGGLFANQLVRETGLAIDDDGLERLRASTPKPIGAWPTRSGRCRAPRICSPFSPRPASRGRSRPAAGSRRLGSISPRSASIRRKFRS